ncbi:zinc-finger-containing protein [Achromobacter xylosoxidans]|uniref:zinc-finger-containing protein n=1 Tax=Alcaligenes xylosoxydans xylosoxydans TaxID=85698 RepID=UPI0009BD0CD2|nr:zinc-finger-containing protein [Achromobacter xylosoxidans]
MTIQVLGVDPRSRSKTQLTAPAPLPYVSRRALARVRDRIEPPKACHCCGGQVRLISNAEIYGREYGPWPFAYLCSQCGAYVGLHPDTDLPLGIMATKATIQARKVAKADFLALVGERYAGKQSAAYAWLARALAISPSICHFGIFNEQQAFRAGEVCRLAREARQ